MELTIFTSSSASWSESDSYVEEKNRVKAKDSVTATKIIYYYYINTKCYILKLTFEYVGSVMLRLQIALWVRLRYVRGSLVKDKRPHGSCAVSLICPLIQKISILITRIWIVLNF